MLNENQKKFELKKISEKKQKAVFDIAKKYGGETTISDIYANSSLTIDEIEQILAQLNAKNYVETKLVEENNIIKYIFPDIKKAIFTEKSSIIEKIGLDKLILKIKYGDQVKRPTVDLERAILQTAQEFGGKLTISKIVEYTGLTVDEADNILNRLSAEGLCRKEFKDDILNIEYVFPEIVATTVIKDSKSETLRSETYTILGVNTGVSKNAIKDFVNQTDKYLIKRKVKKYRGRAKRNLALDTVLPGMGHLSDNRWGFAEYLLYFIIPMVLTAGISFIPSMVFTRYKTFKHYAITEIGLKNNLAKINRNSLIYGLLYLMIYLGTIGVPGFLQYYSYILKLLGLG